jgi:hypothetical protein
VPIARLNATFARIAVKCHQFLSGGRAKRPKQIDAEQNEKCDYNEDASHDSLTRYRTECAILSYRCEQPGSAAARGNQKEHRTLHHEGLLTAESEPPDARDRSCNRNYDCQAIDKKALRKRRDG